MPPVLHYKLGVYEHQFLEPFSFTLSLIRTGRDESYSLHFHKIYLEAESIYNASVDIILEIRLFERHKLNEHQAT